MFDVFINDVYRQPLSKDDIVTFDAILSPAAHQYPDHTALVCQARTWTYTELNDAVASVAYFLGGSGYAPQARIGCYLDNCAEFIILAFAVARSGYVFVPIARQHSYTSLTQIAQRTQMQVLYTLPAVQHDLIHDWSMTSSCCIRGCIALKPNVHHSCYIRNPSRFSFTVFFTSGSTGKPKVLW